jgi:hypothetical protein
VRPAAGEGRVEKHTGRQARTPRPPRASSWPRGSIRKTARLP